jgi:hypothetical protein
MVDARPPALTLARAVMAIAIVSSSTLAATQACSSAPDTAAVTEVVAPDFNQFKGAGAASGQAPVSRLLEKRCGTLDCHGQINRPMRIYGQFGLRFTDDGGNQPGVGLTTDTEYLANYQSVVGLQPEIMSLVVQGNDPPESLMLLRKPLGLERHKGGAVFVSGDDAYQCLTTWLAGQAALDACFRATQ